MPNGAACCGPAAASSRARPATPARARSGDGRGGQRLQDHRHPRTQSQEKKDAIRLLGAELVEVDAVPYSNPDNFVLFRQPGRAERQGTGRRRSWANQFDNVANRQAHVRATAEIEEQTGGKVDAFIYAVGSGGTLAGVAEGLRARNPNVKIGLADPHGAALYSWYADGELKSDGTSISEGIGQGRRSPPTSKACTSTTPTHRRRRDAECDLRRGQDTRDW